MRTLNSFALLAGVASLAVLAGCTVKDVDAPALAGPSTLAHQITLVADRDTLTQNGTDFTDIRITAVGPDGQAENIPLRAQIFVDGVPQDFGTLSTKFPITPTTIRYTAPAASSIATASATSVQIGVTPFNNGDFTGEATRFITVRLQPQGIILPTNPSLVANFTFSPEAPKILDVVTFDASTSTNGGSACGTNCLYSWNFGDGTSGAGQVTTHQFRTVGTFQTTLTVTDTRGATSVRSVSMTVGAGTPPTAVFTSSPTDPGVNQDVFFDATASRAVSPRTITSYDWSFGDGTTGTGSVTSHRYTAPGSYQVSLTTTDDAGTKSAPTTKDLKVGQAVGPEPTAELTCQPGDASDGKPVFCTAAASKPGSGANIVSYTFEWGDGSPQEVQTNPNQSHLYRAAGTFTVTVTVTDSLGRSASKQAQATVTP